MNKHIIFNINYSLKMIQAAEIQAYIYGVCVRGRSDLMNRAFGLPRQTFWKWLTSGAEQGDVIYLNESSITQFLRYH